MLGFLGVGRLSMDLFDILLAYCVWDRADVFGCCFDKATNRFCRRSILPCIVHYRLGRRGAVRGIHSR